MVKDGEINRTEKIDSRQIRKEIVHGTTIVLLQD